MLSMFELYQDFLKKYNGRGKINCSCYIVNEKEFVHQLVDFKESVTDKFAAKKERRMDF